MDLFVWFEVLRPSQQLWLCGEGQFTLPVTTLLPGQD